MYCGYYLTLYLSIISGSSSFFIYPVISPKPGPFLASQIPLSWIIRGHRNHRSMPPLKTPFQNLPIEARKRNARDVLKQPTDIPCVFTKHVTTQLRLGKNGSMNKSNNKLHPCQTLVCSCYPWRSSELDSPFGIAATSPKTQERTKVPNCCS